MNWKSFFSRAKNMDPREAQIFLKEEPENSVQLIDVRQPKEYEREHLAGAILIPLKQLLSRIDELDPSLPTLVYCASGVRSKAACQILMSKDFANVYNVSGGIKAWRGLKAKGHEELGMEFFTGMDFKDAFTMSYVMEDGLQQLYYALAEKSNDTKQKELLIHLAKFEDLHKKKLLEDFQPANSEIPKAESQGNIMEGGFNKKTILEHFSPHLYDLEDTLHLAMMLETQAHDVYSRMARKSDDKQTKALFLHLADEEKMHLGYIAKVLDKVLAGIDI